MSKVKAYIDRVPQLTTREVHDYACLCSRGSVVSFNTKSWCQTDKKTDGLQKDVGVTLISTLRQNKFQANILERPIVCQCLVSRRGNISNLSHLQIFRSPFRQSKHAQILTPHDSRCS
ncbi:uncharacterized protein PHALS_05408 [Plasmopara halstedii]|uniref:Uncharacterized protein n=1 Tax=Plasmopara halstedii TaxID=4781 RepID=A0A0P1ABF8_PLAHL|nr:uncharacterized protein PHALS_05408 [Plasmopara halstedii]CEG37630.1 hypothetical protein PHALS_05408 [Plasmopara halstedii]|eukprot:XP_024573999.1 hypothetical protein PHALS_05408 [Plasmopara halstedii]